MQREIFVPKGDYITPQDAEDFYEQAQRLPRLRINKCINKELVSDYERTRRITPTQHVELVTILEKRLARSSWVQSDYFESKRSDPVSPRTWESAMMRVITFVSAAREAIRTSRSYGNPDLIYSFPSTAVPPPRSSKKRGSTLATREVEPPSGKSTLAVRTSLDVPLITARVCRSCEIPAHMLPACYITRTLTPITPIIGPIRP